MGDLCDIPGAFRPRSTSNRIPLRLLSSSIGIIGISTSLRSLSEALSTLIAMCADRNGLGCSCKAGRWYLLDSTSRRACRANHGKERVTGGANRRSESRAHAPRQRADGVGSTSSAPDKAERGVLRLENARALSPLWTLNRTSCVSQSVQCSESPLRWQEYP